MATASERLLAHLRELGLAIPPRAFVRRTYVGRRQRSEGAWVWEVVAEDGRSLNIGSQWTVGTLMKTPGNIEIDQQHATGDWHIYPPR